MRYLITGASGFVGINLVKRLMEMGEEVVGVDNLMNSAEFNVARLRLWDSMGKMTFIEGDLCNMTVCKLACHGADYVLHQAALGSVPRSVEDPLPTIFNNILSTANMLEASRKAEVKKFVYASSASVYGNVVDEVLSETRPTNPFNPYAVSKLAGEELVKVYWKTYGFPTVALRYFNVFGPHQNPNGDYAAVVPKFIMSLLSGESPTIYGDGTQVRDFTYVDNVIIANLFALNAGDDSAHGEAINISANKLISVNDLFGMIKREVGSVIIPRYEHPRQGDVMGCASNISKAGRCLGYAPPMQIEGGIKRTVKWFKDNFHK